MKAKSANQGSVQLPRRAGPSVNPEPLTFTARQRLHQNIQRLQALDKQLSGDQRKQAELLTSIELVGFKIRHLARQIQEGEPLHFVASQTPADD